MKSTILRLRNYGIAAILLMLCPIIAMGALRTKTLQKSGNQKLEDNTIYIVDGNTTLYGNGEAPLLVNLGATATIYIPKGVTLTVHGADADGRRCAYPGIDVPIKSTLIITGEGTLIAQGGKVGRGGNGGDGGSGVIYKSKDEGTPGKGGYGGYGGGGGAPGIGGAGGDGHMPVEGPVGETRTCESSYKKDGVTYSYDCDGKDGVSTQCGEDGEAMGTVIILGTVTVKAYRGSTTVEQASCGKSGDNFNDNQASGSHWSRYWTAGGGGAGGGGGSGYGAQYGIGGGGPGGQSGATGGSGGTFYKNTAGYYYLHGGSGSGGNGAVMGATHSDTYSSADSRRGGYGGKLMPNTAASSHGELKVASTVALYVEGGRGYETTSNTDSHLLTKISFDGMGGNVVSGEGSSYVNASYGIKPETVKVPTLEGFFFLGYYSEKEGGMQIYDADGKATVVSTFVENETLYAHWSNTHIGSAEQFEQLCKSVAGGMQTSKATYYLVDDINLEGRNCMLGTTTHPFEGTFDGQDYTITVGYNTTKDTTAVFGVVKQATIKNLRTAGTINTSGAYAAGIVSWAHGVTLERCQSSVNIISTKSGDGTHSGLVSVIRNNNYSISNCCFNGTFAGRETFMWGGLIGFTNVNGTLSYSYIDAAPVRDNIPGTTQCDIIARGTMPTMKNCYFTNKLGWNATGGELKTQDDFTYGKVCYLLNGNKTNGVWYQSIGEDPRPCFDVTHRKVFSDYSSTAGSNVYHNRNYVQLSATSMFETGYTPTDDTQIYEVAEVMDSDNDKSLFGYTNKAYTFLFSHGKVTIDDIPNTDTHLVSEDYTIEKYPIYVQSDCRMYEMAIMENGIIVHHFIPGKYNHMYGFFDSVENQFKTVEGADGYIDNTVIPCNHDYVINETSYGRKGTHCYICDTVINPTYYVCAKFQGDGAIGDMGTQTILNGDKLKKNEYRKQYGLFKGWKVYDRNGNQIGKDLYADGEAITTSESFCDTLTFKPQWDDAFTYNGDTLLINDNNISNIDIKDDGINGFGSARTFTAGNITYTRTIPQGSHWGSLCLPFAITEPENGNILLYTQGEVRTTEGKDSILLTRSQVVEAGKPCMFYINIPDAVGNKVVLEATNAPIVLEPADYTTNNLAFHGTFTGTSFKCDTTLYNYYGVQGDMFYKVGSSYVLHPYHAYMTKAAANAAPAKYGISRWEGEYDPHCEEPTGIKEVTESLTENGELKIYDLMGRKVAAPQRPGLYIINGKKVLVK